MKRMSLLLIMVLAACGGSPAPTATTVPSTDMPPTPESTEIAAPISNTAEPGVAQFSVTGDMTITIDVANYEYIFLEGIASQRLIFSDTAGAYQLLFGLPETPEVRTHPLAAYGTEGQQYVAAFTPTLSDETAIYGMEVEGSITLDAVGDRITGTFEFTATNANGGTVTVSGSFTDIPLVFG